MRVNYVTYSTIILQITRAAVTIRNYSNSNALRRTIFHHIPIILAPVSSPLFAVLTKLYILNNNDCPGLADAIEYDDPRETIDVY